MEKSENRIAYLDALRIFACLMVIYNHTNDRGFHWYINDGRFNMLWLLDTFAASMCKVGVPLFFMISGATLIGKDEDIRSTYKRIPRIAIDLVLFSLFYQCLNSIHLGNGLFPADLFKQMISSSCWHLWFLYAYIAFIITLPIIRQMTSGIDTGHYIYMAVIAIILCTALPILDTFVIPINQRLRPTWVASEIFIYPILGYFMHKLCKTDNLSTKRICQLWAINFLQMLICIVCEWQYLAKNPLDSSEMFLSASCITNAITLFITFKHCFRSEHSLKVNNVLSETSKCVFGIYLLHILILHIWFKVTNGIFENHAGIYFSCLAVFGISGVLTFILRKIPLVRRLF